MSEPPIRVPPRDDPQGVINLLNAFDLRVDEHLAPLSAGIEELVSGLEGKRFSSYRESVRVSKRLQTLVFRFGVVFVCQKPGCGALAQLRCTSQKGRPVWKFFHGNGGQTTFHGIYSSIPRLVLRRPPEWEAWWNQGSDERRP